jgi:hypothetical protein
MKFAPRCMSFLMLLACCRADGIDAKHLVGEYELRSPSTGIDALLTTSDRLRLRDNGTYEHAGLTTSGRQFSQGGTWRIAGRNVWLDGWQDFAGVTARNPRGSGSKVNMSWIVETSSPPTIVLDPDRNIFYIRSDQK